MFGADRSDMVRSIAVALIEGDVPENIINVDELCCAIPCGAADCEGCPFENKHAFNRFKQEHINGDSM